MPKKFKKKVKDFDETSDNMEAINTYLTHLDEFFTHFDWVKIANDNPPRGGELPPPKVPKWPP